MSKSPPQITVNPCPNCQGHHTFPLRIRRSPVMSLSGEANQPGPRKFTLLCTCPKTGQTFQTELTVTPPPSERIVSVEPDPAEEEDES